MASRSRRVLLAVVVLLAGGLRLVAPVGGDSMALAASTAGVALLPGAGQFVPSDGTVLLRASTMTAAQLAPDGVTTFSVASVAGVPTGVPASASAVALEFSVQGNFQGGLGLGADLSGADTSVTFPAGVRRNGFDTVVPAADGSASS